MAPLTPIFLNFQSLIYVMDRIIKKVSLFDLVKNYALVINPDVKLESSLSYKLSRLKLPLRYSSRRYGLVVRRDYVRELLKSYRSNPELFYGEHQRVIVSPATGNILDDGKVVSLIELAYELFKKDSSVNWPKKIIIPVEFIFSDSFVKIGEDGEIDIPGSLELEEVTYRRIFAKQYRVSDIFSSRTSFNSQTLQQSLGFFNEIRQRVQQITGSSEALCNPIVSYLLFGNRSKRSDFYNCLRYNFAEEFIVRSEDFVNAGLILDVCEPLIRFISQTYYGSEFMKFGTKAMMWRGLISYIKEKHLVESRELLDQVIDRIQSNSSSLSWTWLAVTSPKEGIGLTLPSVNEAQVYHVLNETLG